MAILGTRWARLEGDASFARAPDRRRPCPEPSRGPELRPHRKSAVSEFVASEGQRIRRALVADRGCRSQYAPLDGRRKVCFRSRGPGAILLPAARIFLVAAAARFPFRLRSE